MNKNRLSLGSFDDDFGIDDEEWESDDIDLDEFYQSTAQSIRKKRSKKEEESFRVAVRSNMKPSNILDALGVDKELSEEEEKERLVYICEELGDMEVTLRNKSLRLWKSFFIHSNIKGIEIINLIANPVQKLSHLSLDIDEENILSFLLSLKQRRTVEPKQLGDYYIFFKEFGMIQQCLNVLSHLDHVDAFQDIFYLFRQVSLSYENESVKSLFSSDPNFDMTIEFDHAISLNLFNKLKARERQIVHGSKIMTFPAIGVISYHLKRFKIIDLKRHQDFVMIKDFRKFTLRSTLKELYETKKFANLTLKCEDKEFKVHREIVLWKINYFYRMIKFGGSESISFKENNEIQLLDISSDVMSYLLEYIYKEMIIKTRKKTNVIHHQIMFRLIHQLEKYQEIGLLRSILDHGFIEMTKEDLKNILFKEGHLLRNENLSQVLIPLFATQTMMKEGEIRKTVRKAIKRYDLQSHMMSMERAFRKQETEVILMKEKHEEEMKEMKDVFDRETVKVKEECDSKIQQMKEKYDEEIRKLHELVSQITKNNQQ